MRIDKMIEDKVNDALRNNGVLDPDLYDIGIIPAPRFMNPSYPKPDEMLYAAVVILACRIPGRAFDRIEHNFQVPEPYGPQVMYDRLVRGCLDKIEADSGQLKDLEPGLDNITAAGLYIP